ncbi:MAG: hypothetical protein WA183_00955 [Chthoniobacterales bacterium]
MRKDEISNRRSFPLDGFPQVLIKQFIAKISNNAIRVALSMSAIEIEENGNRSIGIGFQNH